jgi:hypothetical protein
MPRYRSWQANSSVVITVDDVMEVLQPEASPVWIKPKEGHQKRVADSETTDPNPANELEYVI